MGTSKSYKIPSGGKWSRLKNDITDFLAGDDRITPDQIIGGLVSAAGALSPLPPMPSFVGVRASPVFWLSWWKRGHDAGAHAGAVVL